MDMLEQNKQLSHYVPHSDRNLETLHVLEMSRQYDAGKLFQVKLVCIREYPLYLISCLEHPEQLC